MARVSLDLGGKSYDVACRDGEEQQIAALAATVDSKIQQTRAAVGPAGEVRELLMAALLLADELQDARKSATMPAAAAAPPPPIDDRDLEELAVRLEQIALRLEMQG